jgi:hypothetical protein
MVLPVPHYVWRILASAFSSVNLDGTNGQAEATWLLLAPVG